MEESPEKYRIYVPEKKDNKKHEIVLKSERAFDIMDAEIASIDKKISKIYKDKSLIQSKKYIEIYKIFFTDFCKRMKGGTKINAETGQWIQSTLERMDMANIPIQLLFRETATTHVSVAGIAHVHTLKVNFNKEISGRMDGALAIKKHVEEVIKEDDERIILSNGSIDLYYKVDLIEIDNLRGEHEDISFVQVKAGKVTTKESEDIHTKHKEYFDFLVYAHNEHVEEKKEKNQEAEAIRISAMENTWSLISKLQEYLIDNGFGSRETFKTKVEEFSKEKNIEENLVWYVLKQLHHSDKESKEAEEFSSVLPETESLIEYSDEIEIKEGIFADNYDFFDVGLIDLGSREQIYSKIICNNRVVSQIILRQ